MEQNIKDEIGGVSVCRDCGNMHFKISDLCELLTDEFTGV
jgi:hypothetical protein